MDQSDSQPLRRARRATLLIFLLCGIGVATWAPMVPLAKHRLKINEADLGLILLLLGAGAITTMPAIGLLVSRIGNRMVILAAALVVALMLPVLTVIHSPAGLGAALFVFGSGIGALDVAMNAHAVVVEQRMGRPIMSSFHAMFSVGGLIGSIGLGLLMLPGLSPTISAAAISVLLVITAATQYKHLLPLESKESSNASFRFPKGPVIILGVFSFIFFLSEGAMLDWSGLFLKDNRGFGPAMAGAGYAVFSIAMAIMRFSGDRLVHRYGPEIIVRYGAGLAALGILIAVVIPGPVAALAGFMMVGFGAANIVPVLFSTAGNTAGSDPGIALAAVTTLGYAGQLAGPAMIGFVAYIVRLPVALGLLAIPILAVGIMFRKNR